jgi:hypothetical protein
LYSWQAVSGFNVDVLYFLLSIKLADASGQRLG